MSLKNHFNHEYNGGSPNIPNAVGDRFYGQDLTRDFNFLLENAGLVMKDVAGLMPIIISGLIATKGAGNTLNITTGLGYAEFDISTTDTPWALPPTITTGTMEAIRIDADAETNLALSSAVLDNVTVNYIKLRYKNDDGDTRVRAKKAGTYSYIQEASHEYIVDDVSPTAKDCCLGSFVSVGGAVPAIISKENRTEKYLSMNVSTQDDLNSLIERVGANLYKFKDVVKSIFLKEDSGSIGYKMFGATSFLSDGDDWGQLQTNNCGYIFCESGAFFDLGIKQSYITCDTNNFNYMGIRLVGDTASDEFISNCFNVTGTHGTMYNCGVNLRNTKTTFRAFTGNNIKTNKYIGCYVTNILGINTTRAFEQCYNLESCYVSDVANTSGGNIVLITECTNVNGLKVENISSVDGVLRIIHNSNTVNNVCITNVDNTGSGLTQVITGTDNICNVSITTVDSNSTGTIYGIDTCNNITNCTLDDFDQIGTGVLRAFNGCKKISNCKTSDFLSNSTGELRIFASCNEISNIEIDQIDVTGSIALYGFHTCNRITNIKMNDFDSVDGDLIAFQTSNNSSNITITDMDTSGTGDIYGFHTCNRINNCELDAFTVIGTSTITVFFTCNNIGDITLNDFDSINGELIAFKTSNNISNAILTDFDTSGTGNISGFDDCNRINNCGLSFFTANNSLITFFNCNRINNCDMVSMIASTNLFRGFDDCLNLSNCIVESSIGINDSNGIYNCRHVNNCIVDGVTSTTSNANGINLVDYLSSCYVGSVTAGSGTAEGFRSCNYGSSLDTIQAINSNNDYIDTTDVAITNKVSCNITAWT